MSGLQAVGQEQSTGIDWTEPWESEVKSFMIYSEGN